MCGRGFATRYQLHGISNETQQSRSLRLINSSYLITLITIYILSSNNSQYLINRLNLPPVRLRHSSNFFEAGFSLLFPQPQSIFALVCSNTSSSSSSSSSSSFILKTFAFFHPKLGLNVCPGRTTFGGRT